MNNERQKKIFLMRILVAVIAIAIFLFWFFNFQNVWQFNKLKAREAGKVINWEEIKQEIGGSITDIQKELNDLKEEKKIVDDADILLGDVMDEAQKLASSTSWEIAPPTQPIPPIVSEPVLENNNCPTYINCMPTIGEARPCQIPAGCEGITLIAY